ncbi:RidA family protein [Longimicrobium sp.]|uniref:RidA family protein n=1 Tax=Longimicrobium sp. TaxID=2029185 RepID=UPI002E362688|nr:RidA family protein [Longimicrobium sp.]HEX6039179.1 RidA family protein [Longimicrobium sp.]
MRIEDRLRELGLVLPEPFQSPTGQPYPFRWVRVRGNRAYVSGQLPLAPDGSLAQPLGKVGAEVTPEQGRQAARLAALAAFAGLRRELGDLDRVTAWLRVFGMVNVAPGFTQVAGVVNGFSELLIDVFGPDVGAHARSAVGMAELPFGVAVEIEAEVEIDGRA